jgi:hypothetical protein
MSLSYKILKNGEYDIIYDKDFEMKRQKKESEERIKLFNEQKQVIKTQNQKKK